MIKKLNEGKIKADSLVEESEMEIERKYENAKEQGYNEGLFKANEEIKELRENADEIVQLAYQEKEKMINDSEQDILSFIVDTIDKIYFNSLSKKQDIILDVSKSLIDFVKDTKGLVILKVSMKDYPHLKEHTEELSLLLTTGKLSIKIDKSLKQGHCILISEQGILEVDLEENLERVKAVLQDVFTSDWF